MLTVVQWLPMEAYLFGGIGLIKLPEVLIGRRVEVAIRDMRGTMVEAVCIIKEVGKWDPQRNCIAVKGTIKLLDGRENKFIGIVAVSVSTTIEMIP